MMLRRHTESEQHPDADAVLDVLQDGDCRAFLRELDEPRTAAELCQRCDVPSSTTYRKLDRLTNAGLVEATTKIRRGGNNCASYRRCVDSVTLGFDEGRIVFDEE